jgi:hypothetical protein
LSGLQSQGATRLSSRHRKSDRASRVVARLFRNVAGSQQDRQGKESCACRRRLYRKMSMKMRDTMFNYLVCNEHGRIPEIGAAHLGCAGGCDRNLIFYG